MTTEEKELSHVVDASGDRNASVLKLAYYNAKCQDGNSLIDIEILRRSRSEDQEGNIVRKVGVIPFTYESRRSSALVEDANGDKILICKGAFSEILGLCENLRFEKKVVPLTESHRQELTLRSSSMESQGHTVIMVATRKISDDDIEDRHQDFSGLDSTLTVEGLLSFLNPLQQDARKSIDDLKTLEIEVKVLTGDSSAAAMQVCRDLNLFGEVDEKGELSISGPELERIRLRNDKQFRAIVKTCKVFSKLTPDQKGQVIRTLQVEGHTVGMLGDGVNDCIALREADVGISVSSGLDAAKECADVVVTRKEGEGLSPVVSGVRIGRIAHANR